MDRLLISHNILSKIEPGCLVISDFDGTLFCGDITLGQSGLIPGMVSIMSEMGLKSVYPEKMICCEKFKEIYRNYPQYGAVYCLSVFSGQSVDQIKEIAINAYNDIYEQYINPCLKELYDRIIEKGGRIIILTASPKLYLSGFSEKNPLYEIIGVETTIENGCVTGDPKVIPWGPGKLGIVQSLINNNNKIIAGFGNPDDNDLPWLNLINKNGQTAVTIDENYNWKLIN